MCLVVSRNERATFPSETVGNPRAGSARASSKVGQTVQKKNVVFEHVLSVILFLYRC